MDNNLLVSIIMPAFNAAETVKQAIDSVVAQTYPNWELVVVDDGSTDSTADVVYECTTHDSRIRLITLAINTGTPGRAKNAALPHIRGDLVAFLDSDDLWLPCKLEIQVKHMISEEFALCYSGGWYVDAELTPLSDFVPRYGEGWMFDRLLAQYEINNQTVIIQRSALLALNEPYFNPSIMIGEDCELFMRIARRGNLLGLPDKLVWYRIRENSISAVHLDQSHEGLDVVIRWTAEDAKLRARCRYSVRLAQSKVCFYKAKSAMARGATREARAHLFPAMLSGWKFAVLALATLVPPLWRLCLRYGYRGRGHF